MKFDPDTGQPIAPPAGQNRFDPSTGQPLVVAAATVAAVSTAGAPVAAGVPMAYAQPAGGAPAAAGLPMAYAQQQPVSAQPGAVVYAPAAQQQAGVGMMVPGNFRTGLCECSGPNASQANCCLSFWLPCWAYARIRTLAGAQDANPAGGWTTALGSSLFLFGVRYATQALPYAVGDGERNLFFVVSSICSMLMAFMIWDLRSKVKLRHGIVTDDCGGNDCGDCCCSCFCGCCVVSEPRVRPSNAASPRAVFICSLCLLLLNLHRLCAPNAPPRSFNRWRINLNLNPKTVAACLTSRRLRHCCSRWRLAWPNREPMNGPTSKLWRPTTYVAARHPRISDL